MNKFICHSGGASGTDTFFEQKSLEFGGLAKAYSYQTSYHQSPNKVEISDSDYQEGLAKIEVANGWLRRNGIQKYYHLLARNWAQVKYSEVIIAVGKIIQPGESGKKGYISRAKIATVDGGTGYAIQLAILAERPIYVYDQYQLQWFRWSYITSSFLKCSVPKIECVNFAGIGTRELNSAGEQAIINFFNLNYEGLSPLDN